MFVRNPQCKYWNVNNQTRTKSRLEVEIQCLPNSKVINATPQKRHLAYKNPQKRREENASLLSGVIKCLLLLSTMQQKEAQLSLRPWVGIYCFVY